MEWGGSGMGGPALVTVDSFAPQSDEEGTRGELPGGAGPWGRAWERFPASAGDDQLVRISRTLPGQH